MYTISIIISVINMEYFLVPPELKQWNNISKVSANIIQHDSCLLYYHCT